MAMFFNKKKDNGNPVQELIGIKSFSNYGLKTNTGEFVFFRVSPTNISVLSHAAIENKINNLKIVLRMHPNIEIACTDASECFDNKAYLLNRIDEEPNSQIKDLLQKDVSFLDRIQVEMATSRQFFFILRTKGKKDEQIFEEINSITNDIAREGFEVKRLKKEDIKRFLALYFDASLNGEQLPDVDGEQYLEFVPYGAEYNQQLD